MHPSNIMMPRRVLCAVAATLLLLEPARAWPFGDDRAYSHVRDMERRVDDQHRRIDGEQQRIISDGRRGRLHKCAAHRGGPGHRQPAGARSKSRACLPSMFDSRGRFARSSRYVGRGAVVPQLNVARPLRPTRTHNSAS